ncbi:MAG: hypothetical protein B7Z15_20820, partial [Rhizobiales bacterium 32-66-8]
MAITTEDFGPTIALDGARKVRGNLTQNRIRWMVLAMVLGFGLVGGRLVQQDVDDEGGHGAARVWVQRELSPAIQDRVMRLGIPGIDFITESKRFYPGMTEASHILGSTNIDNQGIAGIEKQMDDEAVAVLQDVGLARGNALEPVELTIDMRVQHAMYQQLTDAMTRYQAIGAAGVMMDIQTGEILALASLPDFNPNEPATALEKDSFNRVTAGIFEVGSIFKTVTLAASLDAGAVTINDTFDARFGVRFGRFTIED